MSISILWLNIFCLIAGLFQIIAGLLILSVEAPNMFSKLPFMAVFSERIGKRPFWVRAVFYILVMIPSIAFYRTWENYLCYSLIIVVAVLYAIIALMHP
jgi:hypothetical protein